MTSWILSILPRPVAMAYLRVLAYVVGHRGPLPHMPADSPVSPQSQAVARAVMWLVPVVAANLALAAALGLGLLCHWQVTARAALLLMAAAIPADLLALHSWAKAERMVRARHRGGPRTRGR